MPHYYFHLRHGSQLTIDDEGEDFPDDDTARAEALESVREILADKIRTQEADMPEAMVIADGDGREVASVAFADAVPTGLRGR
jgi:ketosteroid isomerase-like protein